MKQQELTAANNSAVFARSAARESVLLIAMLRRAGGSPVPVRVRDLSAGGMMVVCSMLVSRNEAVKIELPGLGLVEGKVAWAFSGRVGIQFERPIDPLSARRSGTAG